MFSEMPCGPSGPASLCCGMTNRLPYKCASASHSRVLRADRPAAGHWFLLTLLKRLVSLLFVWGCAVNRPQRILNKMLVPRVNELRMWCLFLHCNLFNGNVSTIEAVAYVFSWLLGSHLWAALSDLFHKEIYLTFTRLITRWHYGARPLRRHVCCHVHLICELRVNDKLK
jgi:hypothetical protein